MLHSAILAAWFVLAPAETSGARLREASVEISERPSVLVIGDSHATTTFGRSLDLLLRTLDARVTTVGSCGVSPDAFLHGLNAQCGYLKLEAGEPDWVVIRKKKAKTPLLFELLAETQPALTIVELGANQIHSAWRNPEAAASDIAAVADAIREGGSECLWVGPPAGRDEVKPHQKIEHLYNVLGTVLAGRCRLLDSRPSALPFLDYERIAPKAGDGRHWDNIGIRGQQAARRWALEVFRAADEMLRERELLTTRSSPKWTAPAYPADPARRNLLLRFHRQMRAIEGAWAEDDHEPWGVLGVLGGNKEQASSHLAGLHR